MLSDLKPSLFEPGNEIYYERLTIYNAFGNNYIQYKSNRDRDTTLLIEEYLNKIR